MKNPILTGLAALFVGLSAFANNYESLGYYSGHRKEAAAQSTQIKLFTGRPADWAAGTVQIHINVDPKDQSESNEGKKLSASFFQFHLEKKLTADTYLTLFESQDNIEHMSLGDAKASPDDLYELIDVSAKSVQNERIIQIASTIGDYGRETQKAFITITLKGGKFSRIELKKMFKHVIFGWVTKLQASANLEQNKKGYGLHGDSALLSTISTSQEDILLAINKYFSHSDSDRKLLRDLICRQPTENWNPEMEFDRICRQ